MGPSQTRREQASPGLCPSRQQAIKENLVLQQPLETPRNHSARTWDEILAPYKRAQLGPALFQLISTALLFAGIWALMLASLEVSYWLTLALSVPATSMVTRLFIFQHDCGHGSFFPSRKANDAVGFVLGVLTLTPYQYWRRTHAIHHATSGNLDRRELGDIDTLTVEEYLALSRWGRLRYRLYRNMVILLVGGGIYQFVLKHRFPFDADRSWKREWAGILWTNLALTAVLSLAWLTIGLDRFFLVHGPILLLTGIVGIWLFYVQHQFEDTYWANHPEWNFQRAGIEGSSLYDLPRVLHWATGNIGYHHVHHLSSLVPNYRLRECFEENPELHQVTRLGFWESLKCARLKLWDQRQGRLVGFRELRREEAAEGPPSASSTPA